MLSPVGLPGNTTDGEAARTTTWIDAFPQFEAVRFLPSSSGITVCLANDLGRNSRPVILQIISGDLLAAAGGPDTLGPLLACFRRHRSPRITEIVDFGNLIDCCYCVTSAPPPPWQLLPDILGQSSEVARLLDDVARDSEKVVAAARTEGCLLRFNPITTWVHVEQDTSVLSFALTPDLHFLAESLVNQPSLPIRQHQNTTALLAPGHSIGHGFVLQQKVGEGGFGEVWCAQQEQPVCRTVALKVLKPGATSPRSFDRFELEQQALARLDHPHIARFFEGGLTPNERPFFTMEWVDGLPITRHCDHHRLPLDECLTLFATVCDAIHHAHQKGILHRDLKPSNVLVASGPDGKPAAKVIDFGIARALEEPLIEHTLITRPDERLGTPATMSPEQATGRDPDVRTDVYGLGILLFELLTGSLPFDPELTPDDLRHAILEMDPPLPSACPKLRFPSRCLRGDLDWIALRCLEKDPNRRYSTVADLARDLERHATCQPVEASPPALSYRASKFIRRHRPAVAAATVTTVGLLIGLFIGIAGYRNARINESRALLAETDARSKLEAAERARAATSSAVQLTSGILSATISDESEPHERAVERAADYLRVQANSIPATNRATLLRLIGRNYSNLGEHEKAISILQEATKLDSDSENPTPAFAGVDAKPSSSEQHPAILNSFSALAEAYARAGRHEEAVTAQMRGIEATRRSPNVAVARLLNERNYLLVRKEAAHGSSEALTDEWFALLGECEKALGIAHPVTSFIYGNLCDTLCKLKKFPEAIALGKKYLQGVTANPEATDAHRFIGLQLLGHGWFSAGNYAEALPLAEQALALKIQEVGSEHSAVSGPRLNLLLAKLRLHGPTPEIISEFERTLEKEEDLRGQYNGAAVDLAVHLLAVYHETARFHKHIPLAEKYLPVLKLHQSLQDEGKRLERVWHELLWGYGLTGQFGKHYQTLTDAMRFFYKKNGSKSLPQSLEMHKAFYTRNRPFGTTQIALCSYLHAMRDLEYSRPASARDRLLLAVVADLAIPENVDALICPAFVELSEVLARHGHPEVTPTYVMRRGARWSFEASTPAGYPGETDWFAVGYDDSQWRRGRAPLGFHDPCVISTVWSEGEGPPLPRRARFRHSCAVPDEAVGHYPVFRLRADDGAAVWLNGRPLVGSGVDAIPPSGASTFIEGFEEYVHLDLVHFGTRLDQGGATVAVEVHTHSPRSSDLIFDLEIAALPPALFEEVVPRLVADFDPEPVLAKLRLETSFELESLPADWRNRVRARLLAWQGRYDESLEEMDSWPSAEPDHLPWRAAFTEQCQQLTHFNGSRYRPDAFHILPLATAVRVPIPPEKPVELRWIARNPHSALEIKFGVNAFIVRDPNQNWSTGTAMVRCNGLPLAPMHAVPAVDRSRLTIRWGDLLETSVLNSMTRGLDGWTKVLRQPPGTAPDTTRTASTNTLTLTYRVLGNCRPELLPGGTGIHWRSSDGTAQMQSPDATAEDATGRKLNLHWSLSANRHELTLHIDDRDAVYPITLK